MISTVDFHSHILCGADHGSQNIATSEAQLKLMSSFGTNVAVATPHFYPEQHSISDFLNDVEGALYKTKQIDLNSKIELCVGAEVMVCQGLENLAGLDRLCIRGTNCILLELPTASSWNRGVIDTIEHIIDKNYTVVLAHIDRYFPKRESEIDHILSLGALAQINASAFFTLGLKRKMLSYIDAGVVCAFGSDLHGVDTKQYKMFASLPKRIGKERFEYVMSKANELIECAERIELY
jgi:protein-tyrosine phosphatase